MQIRLSRAAKRFIARRYDGTVYVWPASETVPERIDGTEPLATGPAPPAGSERSFWRHEVDDVAVMVAATVVEHEAEALVLELRKRPQPRIVARWALEGGAAGGVGAFLESLGLAWLS